MVGVEVSHVAGLLAGDGVDLLEGGGAQCFAEGRLFVFGGVAGVVACYGAITNAFLIGILESISLSVSKVIFTFIYATHPRCK